MDPGVDPEEGEEEIALPLTFETGEPENLAPVDDQGDIAQAVAPGETAHLQQRFLDVRSLRPRWEGLAQGAPDHHVHDLVVAGLCHVDGADTDAVAEDRGPMAEIAHLIHAVRDEDDRDALGAEAAHDGEDLLHLAAVERRGRLVEDQHLRLPAHGLGDLDQLAIGEGEIAHHGAGIDADEAEAHQPGAGLAAHALAVDQTESGARLLAHEEVLGHGQIRDQGQLLEDRDDAHGDRVGGTAEGDRLAARR